jgi:hypothetical protein
MTKDPVLYKPVQKVIKTAHFVPMSTSTSRSHYIVPQPIYVPPPKETDEERWSREYDEENDPDPWKDLDDGRIDDGNDFDFGSFLGCDDDATQEVIDKAWDDQM